MNSDLLREPARTKVRMTSAGISTSEAPLSTIKLRVIVSLIVTGILNVPPSATKWTSVVLPLMVGVDVELGEGLDS
jgi:hypothetical protein